MDSQGNFAVAYAAVLIVSALNARALGVSVVMALALYSQFPITTNFVFLFTVYAVGVLISAARE